MHVVWSDNDETECCSPVMYRIPTQTVVYDGDNIPYLSSDTTLVWLLEHTGVVHQAEEHDSAQQRSKLCEDSIH